MRILEDQHQPDFEPSCDDFNLNIGDTLEIEWNKNKNGIIKVFHSTEVENFMNDQYPPRTPRRVRFGGELVKLRTPDSDTVPTVSDDERTESANEVSENSFTDSFSEDVTYRSHIPIPITPATKLPQIKITIWPPKGANTIKKGGLVYQSSPNHTKQCLMADPSTSKSHKDYNSTKSKDVTPRTRRADVYSPIPVHEVVEVLHNLQASPPKKSFSSELIAPRNTCQGREPSIIVMSEEPHSPKEDVTTSSSDESFGGYQSSSTWEELGLIDRRMVKQIQNEVSIMKNGSGISLIRI